MAAILDFTLKIYVPFNTFWYIFKILLPDDLQIRLKKVHNYCKWIDPEKIATKGFPTEFGGHLENNTFCMVRFSGNFDMILSPVKHTTAINR